MIALQAYTAIFIMIKSIFIACQPHLDRLIEYIVQTTNKNN